MHNLAPQKLVVLNIPAAGWAVSSEEYVEWLRIASPIGMPLKKGCGQLWYQQCHSYSGPAVTWLQGYAPVSCSHWFVSCPQKPASTRNASQAHRQEDVVKDSYWQLNVSSELPCCFLENTLLQSCFQFLNFHITKVRSKYRITDNI